MSALTSIAFCWRVERRDGAGIALTSHDEPMKVDGVRYEPAPGMTPAAIRSELGLEGRSGAVAGSLSSEGIGEADLTAGRWDGAGVTLWAVDWQVPGAEPIELLSGEMGQVASRDGEYSVDLLGAAAKLERPIGPVTSPECRAELGDKRCGVDMSGRTVRSHTVCAAGTTLRVDQPLDHRYRFGRVRFLGGAANGEWRTILGVAGDQLTLRSEPSSPVAPGTLVELVEGCDKSLATCSARFANAANFRGEPHLPGNDILTRYPGA